MSMPPQKILVLSPFESWPLSQGSIVRTHFMVQYLLKSNCVYFVFRGGETTQPFPVEQNISNSPGRLKQLFNPALFFRLWQLIRREDISLIIISQIWSGWHGVLLKLFTGRPLLFDDHNVEYLRWRRMGRLVWPFIALFEFIICRVADEVVCVSTVDKDRLVKQLHIPEKKLTVIPNGADINKLFNDLPSVETVRDQIGLAPGEAMVLFFGSLQHHPNAQAVGIILREIAPRLLKSNPEAKIVIVGLGQADFLRTQKRDVPANVKFIGFVEDVTAVIKSADLVIVPLISGSGTRFKIIESVACGRRVISTTIGAEGLLPEVMGESLIICDDWDVFAKEIASSLTKNPFVTPTSAFRQTYDWEAIWKHLPLPDQL